MIDERDRERHERRRPRAWARRGLLTAGAVVAGWLLLGGSPAEATSGVPAESSGTGLVDNLVTETTGSAALGSAQQAAEPAAQGTAQETAQATPQPAGIVEQAARPATREVLGRALRHSPTLGSDSGSQALGGVGEHNARRSGQSLDGAGRAVEKPGGVLTTLGSGTQAVAFERSGSPQGGVDPAVTPKLGAVLGAAQRVLGPLDEVIPAIPGEPGVASPDHRETPGPSVAAPRISTGPTSGLPAGFGVESLAAAAAGLPGSPLLVGSNITGGSGAGAGNGPALPDPVPPVPGPSHDVPDGIASSASGHGSVDRGQNVVADTSPLVVAPQLLTSLPASSRTTGHPERAVRPSVSPD